MTVIFNLFFIEINANWKLHGDWWSNYHSNLYHWFYQSVSLLSIFRNWYARERERKDQSRKKLKKKKKIWTYRNAIVCTEDKDKCSMQREFERGNFSRKSRVGSWKKNKEKYQARKNVRWRGFLRSLSWRRMTISSSPSRADLIAFLLLHLQFRGNKLEN